MGHKANTDQSYLPCSPLRLGAITVGVYCGCNWNPGQIQPWAESCLATADSCSVRAVREAEGFKDFFTSKVFPFFPFRPERLIFSSQQSWQEK